VAGAQVMKFVHARHSVLLHEFAAREAELWTN